MAKTDIQFFSKREQMAEAILDHVKPTHFVTLSLCQGRQITNPNGLQSWVRGDDVICQAVFEGLKRSLSKRLTFETAWKKGRKQLVQAAYVIEGGDKSVRTHLHVLVAKPDDVSEQRFRMEICGAAAGNPWVMNGQYAVNIQLLADDSEALRATRYALKRGVARLGL